MWHITMYQAKLGDRMRQPLPGGAAVHLCISAEVHRRAANPPKPFVIDQERNAPEDCQSSRPWIANPRESASWRRMQRKLHVRCEGEGRD
jgi:hypothetical protein